MEINYLEEKEEENQFKPLFIILYIDTKYYQLSYNSIKNIYGDNCTITGILGKTPENLVSYKKVSWVFLNKILPKITTDFYFIEEGVLLKKKLQEKSNSYWFSYTKYNTTRPIGCKIVFFKYNDLEKLKKMILTRICHFDFILSKCDFIEIAPYKYHNKTKIPEECYFKLAKKESNFKTIHPKIHYE